MKQSVPSRISSAIHSRLSVPHLGFKYGALAALLACVIGLVCAPGAHAQGTRKDDIVFGPQGRPVAGASVAICTQPANTTTAPCSPLASIFSDPGLTQSLANPTKTDGLGNYHFYAAPGKFTLQVFGPGLTATVIPDVIVPNDPMNPTVSTITSSGGVSAFTLTLGGNLTVGGNGSVTGSLTAGTLNVSNFNPTQLSVTGPRPRVDVTAAAYGAKGDGVADDTAAIQAAINAACNASGGTPGGTIYFPPTLGTVGTSYRVSQPQAPSNAAIFTTPNGCTGLHFLGGNGYLGTQGQFSRAPLVRIVAIAGANPGLGPVFLINQNSTTIENLSINGYNQAVQVYGPVQFTMRNFYLNVANSGQPLGPATATDNCALCLYGTFWDRIDQGAISGTGAANQWGIAMVQLAGQNNSGLFHFSDIVEGGAPNLYDIRGAVTAAAGDIEFDWAQMESVNGSWLTIMENGGTSPQIPSMQFNHVELFDCSGTQALVSLKAAATFINPIFKSSQSGCSNIGPLLQAFNVSYPGAAIQGMKVIPASGVGVGNAATDENGNSLGNVTTGNQEGFDFYTDTSDAQRLRTDYQTIGSNPTNGYNGTPIRMIQKGKTIANLGIDPAAGVLFGDATNPGYSAAVNQTALGKLDVQFPQQMPPTNVAVSAAGGGSCAAGTYYWKVYATDAGFTNYSYPSLEVSKTLTLNQEAQLTWTPALGSNVGGYVVFRWTGAGYFGTQPLYQVAGGSTASFTDTCGAPTGNGAPPPVGGNFSSTFRVTPSSPHIDVGAFGAKCDGVTDDAANIQKAINAAAANGSTIFFPPGSCYIHSALSTTGKNLILRGAGGGWSSTNASEIISDQAIVLLTFGTSGSTTQQGPRVQNLGFRDSSAGHNTVLGAVNLVREDFWFLDNINCGDITAGFCIQLDGTGDFTQYGTILNPKARNVKFPLKTVTNTSAVSIFGGNFVCNSITGSIGIDIETSDTFLIDGTDINQCLVDGVKIFQSNANHVHARFEQDAPNIGTGIAILVDGSGANGSVGNDVSFSSITGFATGISITANATKTRVDEPYFSGNTTNLSDSGVQSLIVTPGDQITLGAPPAVASTGMGFFVHTNVPGQGSAAIPGLLLTNGFGAIAMQDKTTAGGFWFNGDQAGRGCFGAGLYGTCSFFGEFASNTSAAGVRFGNTAGQIDFFADTGLTAGNSYSPNIRATISTAGIALGQQGTHLNTSTANNDLDGTIAISASTSGSHSFATAFGAAPVCTVTPTSDPTAVGVWWATATASAVTANVKTSGTITFNYHCVGNPN